MPLLKIGLNRKTRALAAWACFLWLSPAFSLQAAPPSAEEFFQLCRTGTVEELSAAIAQGVDLNRPVAGGRTPLMGLAEGQVELAAAKAELLLRAGADPGRRDDEGAAALHHAALGGNEALLAVLLAGGAEPNVYDRRGFSPLMYVAQGQESWPEDRRPALLRMLLEKGANLGVGRSEATGQSASTPLFLACFSDAGPETAGLLLSAGAQVNKGAGGNLTPLMAAALKSSDPETVSLLLKARADVTLQDSKGNTALDYAEANSTPAAPEIYTMLGTAQK